MSFTLTDNVKWLAVQYLDTNVQDILFQIALIEQEQLLNVIAQYSDKYSIDTADGIWLDYVGFRLGIFQRPTVPLPETAFGFAGNPNALTFGQGPFINIDSEFGPIDDENFRQFLRVRAQQLITDCTVESIESALELFFESATVLDNQDMTMEVILQTTKTLAIINSVIEAGILFKPAGVLLTAKVVFNQSFGFAGVTNAATFGQGPFVAVYTI